MVQVSAAAEDILMQLIAWEMWDARVDPKNLLRQVPLADLSIIQGNISRQEEGVKKFASVQMVELELLYRNGLLIGDWSYRKDNTCVSLNFKARESRSGHQCQTLQA